MPRPQQQPMAGDPLARRCATLNAVLHVRQARPEDQSALRKIDTATWTADVSPAPPPPADAAFFGERIQPADVLVAEIDRTVAGYAALGQSATLASRAHVLEIRGLAVHPAHQGHGQAARLSTPAWTKPAAGTHANSHSASSAPTPEPASSTSHAVSASRESSVKSSSSTDAMSTTSSWLTTCTPANGEGGGGDGGVGPGIQCGDTWLTASGGRIGLRHRDCGEPVEIELLRRRPSRRPRRPEPGVPQATA